MRTEDIDGNTTVHNKPEVFIKSLVFNDGTKLELHHGSIIVFTGANNSGKSQALRDVEICLDKQAHSSPVVIAKAEYEFLGDINEESFLKSHLTLDQSGYYQVIGMNHSFDIGALETWWKEHTLYAFVHTLFVKRISTEMRLTSSNALQRYNEPTKHPLYRLNFSETLAQKVSDYFRQAFGVDLIVNRSEIDTIPLHVGLAPNVNEYTMAQQDEYYNQVRALPQLQLQGDGMRSFASILLDTFTSEHPITLIDEPEAFLHPPQARVLGKMLARSNPGNRQLLISTHSEDFLQGLLDADNINITVIRIDRHGKINQMSILPNDQIKTLWGNPLLRYSNILSGLFHEKVVVCESDYDCLFYQAVMNAIYEGKNEIAPDVLFTHCGGKSRAKDVVSALKAVNVPVVVVCDFDLLNASQNFKPIVKSFGFEWEEMMSEGMRTIYDSMNARENAWTNIKKLGKFGFAGKEPAAYENVERICKSIGLFVVPVGEMECFDKTINKEKKEWVYHVLENYDLAVEPKLEEARKFVQAVVDFRPFANPM